MLDIDTAPAPSDQDEIAGILLDQAERLFAQEITPETLKAADEGRFPAAAWGAVQDAGLTLALVPEESGGAALSGPNAGLLLRLSAYHALPAPFADTLMAEALWTRGGGAPFDGSACLVAAGDLRLTGAPGVRTLTGAVAQAAWGAEVDHLLLTAVADDGRAHLVLLPAAGHEGHCRRNVAHEPRVSFTLDAVPVAEDAIRPLPEGAGEDALVFGAFARAQQMVGAMERCLDLALTYANERKQFGKPIGRFQAVQHMLAEAAGQCAAAAAAAELSAAALGTAAFSVAVGVAKARAGEAAGKVAEVCHQVHGAMGFTHEHPLHFFTRRLWSWRDEFGREAVWQERIGRAVCAKGGDALWPMLVTLRAAG